MGSLTSDPSGEYHVIVKHRGPLGMLTIHRFPIPYPTPGQNRQGTIRLIAVERRSNEFGDEEGHRSHLDVMLDVLYGVWVVLVHNVTGANGQALCDALECHYGLPILSNRVP